MAQGDSLKVGDSTGRPGQAGSLTFGLTGASPVVGMQFDVIYPASQAGFAAGAVETKISSHKASAREISPGHARMVIYPVSNAALPKADIVDLPLQLSNTAPAGGPMVSVTNIIFCRADGTSVPAEAVYGPLTQWKETHFTASELNEAAVSGDDADPDGDGVSNLHEYLGDTDPKSAASFGSPAAFTGVATVNGEAKLYMALQYSQRANLTGTTVTPEASNDLNHWQPVAPVQTGSNGTTVEMQARVFLESGQRTFLRLNVSRP